VQGKAIGAVKVGKPFRVPERRPVMADNDATAEDMASFLADINELIRRGLIAIRIDNEVMLTDKGLELLNDINAQTWN
jgi:hypothetical protein